MCFAAARQSCSIFPSRALNGPRGKESGEDMLSRREAAGGAAAGRVRQHGAARRRGAGLAALLSWRHEGVLARRQPAGRPSAGRPVARRMARAAPASTTASRSICRRGHIYWSNMGRRRTMMAGSSAAISMARMSPTSCPAGGAFTPKQIKIDDAAASSTGPTARG